MKDRYKGLSFYSHNMEIKIEGFQLSRLIDKAVKNGLQLKNIRPLSDMELTCTNAKADLKALKKLAKSVYRITMIRENGAVYKWKKHLKAPAALVGFVLAAAIVISQTLFIKEIEISGYRAIPEEELRNCLKEAGVYEGAYRPEIDWDEAENLIYKTFPQVTWVQVGYKGRLAILNISETSQDIYETKEGEDDGPTFNNVIAAESGYIESIHVWKGLALVEAGDYVEEGQVLISGCVPLQPTTYDEGAADSYFVNAAGEITAIVPYRLTFNQERYDWEGNEKTEAELTRRVEQQLRAWTKENLPEKSEILNKSLNFSANNNIMKVGVTIEVRREIGTIQEDIIGKDNSDTG